MSNLKCPTTPRWERVAFRVAVLVVVVLAAIVYYLYKDDLGALLQ